MKYRVTFEPEAMDDLIELYDYITLRTDPVTALGYIERIEAACDALSVFPQRGNSAEDDRKRSSRSGLRKTSIDRVFHRRG